MHLTESAGLQNFCHSLEQKKLHPLLVGSTDKEVNTISAEQHSEQVGKNDK